MNALQVFTFSDIPIRTVLADGEPWFVTADICKALGLSNATMAARPLDDDEKGFKPFETPGGLQSLAVVNESGMYAIAVRCDKATAKPFRRWITREVIPSIRKTGRYEFVAAASNTLPVSANPQALPGPRELALMVIAEADRADAAEALADERGQALAVVTPKAESWDVLASADGDLAVADAAKLLSRDPNIKIGRDRLFTYLGSIGWIHRQRGDQRYRVYQSAIETGRLSELPSSHYHPRTGELVLDPPQVRVTTKGLHELHRRLGGVPQPAITST